MQPSKQTASNSMVSQRILPKRLSGAVAPVIRNSIGKECPKLLPQFTRNNQFRLHTLQFINKTTSYWALNLFTNCSSYSEAGTAIKGNEKKNTLKRSSSFILLS